MYLYSWFSKNLHINEHIKSLDFSKVLSSQKYLKINYTKRQQKSHTSNIYVHLYKMMS